MRRSRICSRLCVFFTIYAWFVFFIPNYLLDADNFNPANPLVTPAHIVPEWYLLPFYAILRAIPNKLMPAWWRSAAAMALLAFLPWLDTSPVQVRRNIVRSSGSSSGCSSSACVGLGYLGSQEVSDSATLVARVAGDRLLRLSGGRAAGAWTDREDQAAPGLHRGRRIVPRRPRRVSQRIMSMTRFKASLLAAAVAGVRRRWAHAVAQDSNVEQEQPKPDRQTMEFPRRVRQVRPGAVAARLPGLSGGLLQLPPAQHPLPLAGRFADGPGFSEAIRSRRWRRATR